MRGITSSCMSVSAHVESRSIIQWPQGWHVRRGEQSEVTLVQYMLHIDLNWNNYTRKRQGYPRKCCVFDISCCRNKKDSIQRYWWPGARYHWGRVWSWFGTYGISNPDIQCRNKGDENKISRKGRLPFDIFSVVYNTFRECNSKEWRYTIIRIRLWSEKSGGSGNRSGMAQINIASLPKTMRVVFIAITYNNRVEKCLDILERTENTSASHR